MKRRSLALAIALTAVIAGCSADGQVLDLPPAALEGHTIARSKGCAACHGSNGGGGVGPAFVGLFGSERLLKSGETVTADRDYLIEAIVEPDASLVDGYNLPMPRTELTTDEIDAVIAYIEELAEVDP